MKAKGPICLPRQLTYLYTWRRCAAAGLKLTEEIHVCPVAESPGAATPYTTLADMKDKQRVSVWPCSSFNSGPGGTAPPISAPRAAPAPTPAPAAPSTNARELARQRAREKGATASPAVTAARERAKAQLAAKKAAAGLES
eukprot:COSAG03_NODE_1249_length_4474_cov_2.287771_3_plen_141_part_00